MKNFLLFLFLGLTSTLQAARVDIVSAADEAKGILGKNVTCILYATNYYVFQGADGNGFAIIASDNTTPSVIGYSVDGQYDLSDVPSQLALALQQYKTTPIPAKLYQRNVSRVSAAEVKPLCKTQWGQNAPYNNLVPKINGEACPSGCVATALAQILASHKWPEVGEGNKWYNPGITGYANTYYDFTTHTYQWDAMQNTKKENLDSDEASAAVAQLLFDCGVQTDMSYSLEGSGTNDDLAMKALYTYMGYKASTLDLQRRDCYATQEEWDELVKNELTAGRPVLYGGFNPTSSGHEFIIDGYDTKGMFHVNWGWDGKSDGYFAISQLYGFTDSQSMVCGIQPDYERTDKIPQQTRVYLAAAPTVDCTSVALADAFHIINPLFYNYSRTYHKWIGQIALYDTDGNQLQTVSTAKEANRTYSLGANRGQQNQSWICRIPTTVADGSYVLRTVFQQDGYTDYVLPDMLGGSHLNNIKVTIKNGVAYFDDDTAVKAVITPSAQQNGKSYTVSGQPADDNYHGIVIQNGHKAIRR